MITIANVDVTRIVEQPFDSNRTFILICQYRNTCNIINSIKKREYNLFIYED